MLTAVQKLEDVGAAELHVAQARYGEEDAPRFYYGKSKEHRVALESTESVSIMLPSRTRHPTTKAGRKRFSPSWSLEWIAQLVPQELNERLKASA